MSKKTILVYASRLDPQADMIIKAIGNKAPIFRLNTEDMPLSSIFDLSISNTEGMSMDLGNLENLLNVYLNDISSVYWGKPNDFGIPNTYSPREKAFCEDELSHLTHGIFNSIGVKNWVNHPSTIARSELKILQLKVATSLGLTIPDTIITNNPTKVREFYRKNNGNIVFKVLRDPTLGMRAVEKQRVNGMFLDTEHHINDLYVVYTTKLSEEHLSYLEETLIIPAQFQVHIDKLSDIRVTIIDDQIFAAEIMSQSSTNSIIDWRTESLNLEFRAINLPSDISNLCFKFVRAMNLRYAALDFIRDKQNSLVFLECNPSGMFGFVEAKLPEYNIAEKIAKALLNGDYE